MEILFKYIAVETLAFLIGYRCRCRNTRYLSPSPEILKKSTCPGEGNVCWATAGEKTPCTASNINTKTQLCSWKKFISQIMLQVL